MEVLVGLLVLCFVVLALAGGSRPSRRRSDRRSGSHVPWYFDGGWGGDGGCGGGDGGGGC